MGAAERVLTPWLSPRHFLGAELRWWRHHRDLSQANLGALIGISGDMLRRVENAQRTATTKLVADCDRALGTGGALSRILAYATATKPTNAAPGPTIVINLACPLFDGDSPSTTIADASGTDVTRHSAVDGAFACGPTPDVLRPDDVRRRRYDASAHGE